MLRFSTAAFGWSLLIATLVAGVYYGISARRWAWDQTSTIRFRFDISNGYTQGNRVVRAAKRLDRVDDRHPWLNFFSAYHDVYRDVVEDTPSGDYILDYTPSRLLVMSLWVKHLREQKPPIMRWNSDYATTAPLLHFNAACEGATAVGLLLLVRHWRRARNNWRLTPQWSHPWREWPAVLAGLAVWFNPAMIWNAQVWPQWDVWLLPFFVFGVLAASKDRWLLAGFLVMIGATFKGQVLMVMPVLLLWPIFAGKPLAAVRLLIGMALTAALTALPWMAVTDLGLLWLAGVLVTTTGTALIVGRRKKFDALAIIMAGLAAVQILSALLSRHDALIWSMVIPMAILAAVVPRFVSRSWLLPVATLVMSVAVFVTGFAFDGQFDWFEVGYAYPQRHRMSVVISGNNLGEILKNSYEWQLADTVSLPYVPEMTMRAFLITLFAIALVLCAIATAVHARRRSPRVLMSIAAAWVMLFTLLPQMHERYLMWGAVLMSAGVGVSVGYGLLAALVTWMALGNMAMIMFRRGDASFMPDFAQFVAGMFPSSAWGMVMLALVCLFTAMVPEKASPLLRDSGT